jgi:serpin B
MARTVVLAMVCLGLMAGLASRHEALGQESEETMKSLGQAVNGFALDLLREAGGQDENIFLSPYSISTALAMTYGGARGATAEQMSATLKLPLKGAELHSALASLAGRVRGDGVGPRCAMNVANALWLQKGLTLKAEFTSLMKASYNAGVKDVDFQGATEAARTTINAWVAKETQEKIRDLIVPGVLDASTQLVLTNAIYFKGDWVTQFDPAKTVKAPFHGPAGSPVEVPMMNVKHEFRFGEQDGVQVLELPYVGGSLSMVVLLPTDKAGLPALEKSLDPKRLAGMIESLSSQKVDVYLPRFELEAQFQLAKALSKLGMPLAFGGGADFSGITADAGLSISDVIHKAMVEVNEEGTVAAAATAVVMRKSISREEVAVFRADHPFLFAIRHVPSDTILFLGRLAVPKG